MDVKLGEEVGYTVRFDDQTNPVGPLSFSLLINKLYYLSINHNYAVELKFSVGRQPFLI